MRVQRILDLLAARVERILVALLGQADQHLVAVSRRIRMSGCCASLIPAASIAWRIVFTSGVC